MFFCFFLSKPDNTVQQDYYELLWVALFCVLQIFCCKLELHATVKLFPKKQLKKKKKSYGYFFFVARFKSVCVVFEMLLREFWWNLAPLPSGYSKLFASVTFFLFHPVGFIPLGKLFWQNKNPIICHLLSVSLVIFVSDALSVHFNECTVFIFSYTPVLHYTLLIVSVLFWHAVQCRFENNHG